MSPRANLGFRGAAPDSNFPFGYQGINQRHSGVEFNIVLKLCRHIVLVKNRFYGTLYRAGIAFDAIVGLDEQHFRSFVKAIAGASRYAGGVFAAYALFGDDKSHGSLSGEQKYLKAVK